MPVYQPPSALRLAPGHSVGRLHCPVGRSGMELRLAPGHSVGRLR